MLCKQQIDTPIHQIHNEALIQDLGNGCEAQKDGHITEARTDYQTLQQCCQLLQVQGVTKVQKKGLIVLSAPNMPLPVHMPN